MAVIRQLGQGDVAIFKAIRLEALRLEPDAFASTATDWESLSDAEWNRRMTANPVFVAFREAFPVGVMGLLREQSSKTRHRATIIMVYVNAIERGRDTAQSLLDHATSFAQANGIRQLELRVNSANARAIRFYQRNGYQRTGFIPCACLHADEETDELMMVRRIDM
ncbi:MAG: N-acetyltransferase family protein [Rhizobiaceae bacterium]